MCYIKWCKKIRITSQYSLKPCIHFHGNVRIELDLSNCETKFDLGKAIGEDTSKFAKKVDLTSLK